MRDARPFLAHRLRQQADDQERDLSVAIHRLARWVENLPAEDPRMARIAGTDALNYADGSMEVGNDASALVDEYATEAVRARERWLDAYAAAVERFWSERT